MRGTLAVLCLGAGLALPGLRGQAPVQLPTFTVKEPRLLPQPEAWRHAQVPGFEILSDDSDRRTRALVDDFLLYQRAVGIVWPEIRRHFDLPVALVLCAHSRKIAEFLPEGSAGSATATESLTLRDREQAAIVINLAAVSSDETGGGSDDYSRAVLREEYAHFLISRMEPRAPPWLESALTQLFTRIVCTRDAFGLPGLPEAGDLPARSAFAARLKAAGGRLEGPPPAGLAEAPEMTSALARGALIPLGQMFAAPAGGGDGARARQCYEFAHLCLFGEPDRWSRPFLRFAVLASLRPADEALFRECFGMGYREMQVFLWAYTGFARDRSFAIHPANGAPPAPIPAVALRAASDAEVGRIKGDVLRMGHRDDASHLNLIAPYLRGARDPQLLAALGLEEYAAGRMDRAGRFLEAATAARTTRARAYLELARLRYRAAPGDLMPILQLIWSARALPPPLPETYEFLAEAWSRPGLRLQRGNLAALDEGVRLFPYDADLVYQDALLQRQNGFAEEAAALIRLGLELAPDQAARERLLKLQKAP